MANFGWAYINCDDTSGSSDGGAYGPSGSVQFMSGAGNTSGTINFMYHSASTSGYAANTLVLTGTLVVSGTVSASHYHIKDIAEVDATGSTFFGDSNDDVHVRTGSLYVGRVSADPVLNVDIANNQVKVTGFRGGYSSISANGVTSSNAAYIYGVQQTGDVEVRLHSASEAQDGAVYIFKDEVSSRAGSITISASAGGGTIDGESFYNLAGTMPAINIYSNGTNWFVF